MMARLLESAFVLLAITAAAASGCDRSTEGDDDIITSHEALCAGAAPEYAGGFVRASGCAFEQHAENIAEYGEALADGSSMIDASGVVVASALYRCDGWILGEDADGVPIVIDTTTGEVESHGLVHKGTPTSDLPGTLALPLAIR